MFQVILYVEVIINTLVVEERQFSFTANIPAPRHVLVVSFCFRTGVAYASKHQLCYSLCSCCPAYSPKALFDVTIRRVVRIHFDGLMLTVGMYNTDEEFEVEPEDLETV